MNKEDFIEYLKLQRSNPRSLNTTIRNSKHIQNLLRAFSPEKNVSFTEMVYLIINDEKIPMCKNCNENKVKFNRNEWRYREFCSQKCSRQNESTISKLKETNLHKYNAENPFGSKEIQEKIKATNIKKYGVEYAIQSKEVLKKQHETNMLKYGSISPFGSIDIRNKIANTCIERYGSANPFGNKEIQEKIKLTMVDLYPTVREKYKKTMMERYGVEYPLQYPKFFEKANSYRKMQFSYPSGKIVYLQGYEPLALNILLENYSEEDILIGDEITKELGTFHYTYQEKKRRYYPDIYIKSISTIIEVKSSWTMMRDYDRNILKMKSCLDAGLSFEFMIL